MSITTRVLPLNGAPTIANIPPPPVPTQRQAVAAGTPLVTTASTLTSSAVLTFGVGNIPAWMAIGLFAFDATTTGAIASSQRVQSINAAAGTVTLSANVNATVNSGDTIVFSGVSIGTAPNPYADVAGDPSSGDAATLASSGFIVVARSGVTAARPSSVKPGEHYLDTTLGYLIIWNGSAWINPATGAPV
jgi:hypothetical protein